MKLPLAAQALVSRTLGRGDRRYRVVVSASGLTVTNPRQRLVARFTDKGVQVRSGFARLGLTLRAYGYGHALRPVAPAAARASGNRVSYRRGSLIEWYQNGPLGIEQGFTLRAPPAGRTGEPLTLSISLSGNLKPSFAPGEDGLIFATRSGRSSFRYRGVAAFGANGRQLHAWLEVRGRRLLLHVDGRGARYPLTIDPFVQQAKLTATDGVSVGDSVAVSGRTIVAGDTLASVGGNIYQGAAYVFVEPASGWANATETAKLTASDGAANDYFGWSVGVSGGTIVVGVPYSPYATGGGNIYQGAAYVFVEPASGWANATETAKLTASDGAADDLFGFSVAVSGSTVAAGAPKSAGFGGNGNQGAAYVFVEPASGWANATETAKLTASDGAAGDSFGWSVAVAGNTLVAGVVRGNAQGAAYVFVEPAGGWANATETAKLTASDGATVLGNFLGVSVAVAGDTIVAGAPYHFDLTGQGAAYVFVEPASGWANATETAKLTASDGADLGWSVAVEGGTIVAGAPYATVCGNSWQGAAYVFVEPAGGWANATETAKLTASDGAGVNNFAYSVAVEGGTVVAGGLNTHAAYVFGAGAPSSPSLCISLAPDSQTRSVGSSATVTAKVTDLNGNAVPGVTVNFSVTSGPNSGTSGSGVANADGIASFTYTSSLTGTDTVVAAPTDSLGNTRRSNAVTVTWYQHQLSVQGRVIEGITSVSTRPSTVATFTDTNPDATASQYAVTINWGDGTSSSTGSGRALVASAPAAECTYQGVPPNGQCFVIKSAHMYLNPGTYSDHVAVSYLGEPSVNGTGIAEIQTSAGPSLPQIKNMVGIVQMIFPGGGPFFACTATVIASPGMNMILTAAHCSPQDAIGIEFAPAHKGDCNTRKYLLSSPQCTGLFCFPCSGFAPSKTNPFGVWTARTLPDGNADVWWAGSPPPPGQFVNPSPPSPFGRSHDYAFIILQPNSDVAGKNVQQVVGGLPIQFFYGPPPTTQTWSAFAYDASVDPSIVPGAQNLQTCINAPANTSISTLLEPSEQMTITCKFDYAPYNYCYGCSGGPWVNGANGLPAAVGAVNDFCTQKPVPTACGTGTGPNIEIGNTMGQDAVPVFIAAATTPPP